MIRKKTPMENLLLLEPERIEDERGYFAELFHKEKFRKMEIDSTLIQVNESSSQKGVIRGLHFQWDKPLDKFIRVLSGSAFMVAVDFRKRSLTFGKWLGKTFNAKEGVFLYAPFGFATGFCTLEDNTRIEYFYTALYNKEGEGSVRWNDPDIDIGWPIKNPILSPRDAEAQLFAEWQKQPESDFFSAAL